MSGWIQAAMQQNTIFIYLVYKEIYSSFHTVLACFLQKQYTLSQTLYFFACMLIANQVFCADETKYRKTQLAWKIDAFT